MPTLRFSQLATVATLLAAASGCAAFSYQIPSQEGGDLAALGGPVFVEPILENAELELRSASQTSGNVTTTTYWKDKPFFAQPHVRRQVYAALLARLQPRQMVGTDALPALSPDQPVRLLRTTVVEHRVVDTNSTSQYMTCVLGLSMVALCPLSPLALIYNAAVPLRQQEHIRVVVQLYEVPRHELDDRLVTPADSVHPLVDTRGLKPLLQREFETDATGEQGIFSSAMDGWFMPQQEREERLVLPFAAYLEQVIASTAVDAQGVGTNTIVGSGVPAPTSPVGDDAADEQGLHAY